MNQEFNVPEIVSDPPGCPVRYEIYGSTTRCDVEIS